MAVRTGKQLIAKNSPKILAAMGIGFGVGSVAFAVKGTINAVEIVNEKKAEDPEKELTKTDIVKCVWKEYVPTVGLTVASAACIVGSVHISARRLAMMTAAYAMSEDSFKKYKEKAREMFGDRKEEELRGSIHQDEINLDPPEDPTIIRTGNGETLFKDAFTGQYFYSSVDSVRRTMNEINNLMLHDYYVCINDVETELGIEQSKAGIDYGWNFQDGSLIEPLFTTELSPDGRTPIIVLDYMEAPKADYKHYCL